MAEFQIGRFSTEDQERIIKDFLLAEIEDIIADQEAKGLKASGESAKQLRVETSSQVGGEIIRGELVDGSGSFQYQEDGRGPYKGGDTIVGGLWGKIYTWLRYKKYGLEWSTKKDRISLAWAITKKIQMFGTYTYLDAAGPTGVLSDNLTDEKYKKLSEEILTIENVTEIKDILTKGLFK